MEEYNKIFSCMWVTIRDKDKIDLPHFFTSSTERWKSRYKVLQQVEKICESFEDCNGKDVIFVFLSIERLKKVYNVHYSEMLNLFCGYLLLANPNIVYKENPDININSAIECSRFLFKECLFEYLTTKHSSIVFEALDSCIKNLNHVMSKRGYITRGVVSAPRIINYMGICSQYGILNQEASVFLTLANYLLFKTDYSMEDMNMFICRYIFCIDKHGYDPAFTSIVTDYEIEMSYQGFPPNYMSANTLAIMLTLALSNEQDPVEDVMRVFGKTMFNHKYDYEKSLEIINNL